MHPWFDCTGRILSDDHPDRLALHDRGSGTRGRALPFFGLFSIPLAVEKNADNHEFWEEIHEFAWKIVAVLVIVHVLGAIYNHFIAKNDVMRRMTVGLK